MAQLIWHGHSTIELRSSDNFVVVIDPWFNNPVHPTKQLPEKVDVILVTHDHFDHVGDVVALAQKTGAQVVGTPETMNRYSQAGIPEGKAVGMNIGGTVQFGNFSAHMVHAFHTSESGMPTGYIMNMDGLTIYHLGDTGLFGDLKLFGELHDIDYALIPVGGHYTMDYKHGALAAQFLKTRKAIPIHYKTFPLLLQDANLFAEEVAKQAPGTETVIPNIGEPIQL